MARAIGVLALQGDFLAHARALESIGAVTVEVRRPEQLGQLAGLVIPGGESTTLLKHFDRDGMGEAIRQFHDQGGAIFGTCAGLIVLAREVVNPPQDSLGLIDAVVERNGFGRQTESFVEAIEVELPGRGRFHAELVFIRAPRIQSTGRDVEVLVRWKGEPILIRQGFLLAGTFHPEMTGTTEFHRFFIDECVGRESPCRDDPARAIVEPGVACRAQSPQPIGTQRTTNAEEISHLSGEATGKNP